MRCKFALVALLTTAVHGGLPPKAEAGPLLEWLFRGRQASPAYPVGGPIPLGNGYGATPNGSGYAAGYPGYAAGFGSYAAGYPGLATGGAGYASGYPGYPAMSANMGNGYTAYTPWSTPYTAPSFQAPGYAANFGNYYGSNLPTLGPSGAGYNAPLPTGLSGATLPPTPMSFVPNYNSSALKAPTTYYRPLLTTDPNTGGQVVAMAPCTSYQYLTQRVPGFGQSALYGSYQPPQMSVPSSIPTYSLPSGGIPLASITAAMSLPGAMSMPTAALGYTPYSSYQPSYASNYPTTNYNNSYTQLGNIGSSLSTGGSSGTYYHSPIPGLTAPPSSNQAPSYTQPGPSTYQYSQPAPSSSDSVLPGYSYSSPSSPAPPASGPSFSPPSFTPGSTGPGFSDPADRQPSLPDGSRLRPQLQRIVPGISNSGSESANNQAAPSRSLLDGSNRDLPSMSPIPMPEGLDRPKWSPGLLRTDDLTASRTTPNSLKLAGQSKRIQWASFESNPRTAEHDRNSQTTQPVITASAESSISPTDSSGLRPLSSANFLAPEGLKSIDQHSTDGLVLSPTPVSRPIEFSNQTMDSGPTRPAAAAPRTNPPTSVRPNSQLNNSQLNNSGWKASR
jgi:hypothetical protein